MSDLVTGDAVVLGLSPARLPSRALSVCVDLVLAWTVYLVLTMAVLTATASLDAAAVAAVQVALFLLVLVGGPVALETLTRGRSVGKLACGLRVVREDGGPIRFRHALVRGAIGVVELQLSLGVLAAAASLVSARGRRVGDVFAGTLVVRERVPAAHGASMLPAPPPWLAGQLGGLDLSRVPDRLWLAIRQYLLRARQLDEGVGRSMAERLAADVTAWTGMPVPEGVPAEAYLAGVLAERQARDTRRAFGGREAGEPVSRPEARSDASGPTAAGDALAGDVAAGDVTVGASPSAHSLLEPPAPTPKAGDDGSARESGAAEKRGTGFVPPL